MQRILGLVLAGIVALTGGTASAVVIQYNFTLDGLQEVPPVPTPGTGTATVILDTDYSLLSWHITYQNLLAPVTAAHFHGPAAPGQNAGVQINIGAISGLQSPMIAANVPITAAQSQMMQDGLMYVNIHTTLWPGGEIRGQVVPEPASLALLALAGLPLARRR